MENYDSYDPKNFEKGKTIYTILRHVSRSGMKHVIDLVTVVNNKIIKVYPRNDGGYRDNSYIYGYDSKNQGYIVEGCNMDMGCELVYSLGRHLFKDGYYFNQQWL